MRQISFREALNEVLEYELETNEDVFLLGGRYWSLGGSIWCHDGSVGEIWG